MVAPHPAWQPDHSGAASAVEADGGADERTAWIALASVMGVGEISFGALVGAAGGAQPVLALARSGRLAELLRRGSGGDGGRIRLGREVQESIASVARDPLPVLARLAELGLWTLTPLDRDYPARLRDLDPPPAMIHGWGDAGLLHAGRAVAVVGTRRPSPHGRLLAARISSRLAGAGAVVVSGMAIGIDGAAHAATIEAGGRTLAVLGGGHARPGPRAHRPLLRALLRGGGAAISELAPDAAPTRGTFPRRNRIISALSEAVVVVEAPLRSGALITARHALEQGRQLFVVPGRPGDPLTAGCLALLRESPARPVVGLVELLQDLGYLDLAAEPGQEATPGAQAPGPGPRPRPGRVPGRGLGRAAALASLEGPQRQVAVRITEAPAGIDALVAATRLSPGVVAGALTLLQLRGWVQPLGPAYLPAGPLLVDGDS